MDYLDRVALTRHASFAAFDERRRAERLRLILFTTRAATSYLDHRFADRDVLLFGRESSGVPDNVHAEADVRLLVPMRPDLRSLNVAMTCAMVLGEALRQVDGFSNYR
jgi:tRNA (cytidine/uridine-2'-O-)-methyltransferase